MTSPTPPQRAQVPGQLQRDFATHWNGYDRAEVRSHLARVEEDMRQLAAERDKATGQVGGMAKQLDALRAENAKLKARVDELKEPPRTLDDLDDRMRRVGKLAQLKADEVTNRAKSASEDTWKATAKASIALRERYRTLLKELDTHAEALHSEHRAALEETRAEVQELMVEAVRRREALDAEAERKRRAIEQEFDATMAAKRKELEKHLADTRTAAKQQAERRMAQAQAEARRTVAEANVHAQRRTDEANRVIDRLLAISKNAHGRMDAADKILAEAEATLKPSEEEQQQPAPRAEDAVPAKDAKPGQHSDDEAGERTKPSTKPTVKPEPPKPNGTPNQRKPQPTAKTR
ncbi:MAG: cell division protein DivIVA [Thermocrispum sp.]